MSDKWAALGVLPGREGEHSVQANIRRALTYLSEQDQNAFRKRFRDLEGNERQAMHTFRELLAGACMVQEGFTARYEPPLGGQTPDWHFAREGAGEFFADVVNFHSDSKTEAAQEKALEGDGVRMWCDWAPSSIDRLYPSLQTKASKYKDLALARRMPFVVFAYGHFFAALQPQEVEACLFPEDGLFNQYPTLSGVYHMRERGQFFRDPTAGYFFDFYANPKAPCPAPWLRDCALPYLFPAAAEGTV